MTAYFKFKEKVVKFFFQFGQENEWTQPLSREIFEIIMHKCFEELKRRHPQMPHDVKQLIIDLLAKGWSLHRQRIDQQ